MEKALNIGNNGGGLKLPIGYRFKPTDEEIVVHYLKRKVLSLPLPASIIPDFDFSQIDPFALQGDANEKRYFFYKKKKSESGNEMAGKNSRCASGYWKPVGKGRLIVDSHHPSQTVVGFRTTFAFRHGNRLRATNDTRWLLHEYHLVRSGPTPNSLHLIRPMGTDEYWVVCGLFQKKRRKKKTKQRVLYDSNNNSYNNNKPCVISTNSGPTTPTMSSSSEITDNNENQELTSVSNSCTREP